MTGVDVLAVLDRAAYEMHDYRPGAPQPMREASYAVAELIVAAGVCAEAFSDFLDAEVPDVIARDYPALVMLRAALAKVRP